MISSLQRLSRRTPTLQILVAPSMVDSMRTFSDSSSAASFFPGAVVHCRGDLPYGSREYVLLPPHVSLEDVEEEENQHFKLASLQAHRNIVFGAVLHYQKKYVKDDPDEFEPQKPMLVSACLPLLDAALIDAAAEAEQPQALSTIHGLSVWVATCFQGRAESKVLAALHQAATATAAADEQAAVSLAAVQSIATGIPRPGHSVVGQGTYRDGAAAWEDLAKEFVGLRRSEECQLYQARGAELVGVDLLADTRPDYMKSAGGSMARFFFL